MTLLEPESFSSHANSPGTDFRNEPTNALRPIQYLGNKQRSLDTIVGVVETLVGRGAVVADLFSGTSVVAQGIASSGCRTIAVDVSPACATIARATLGCQRATGPIDADRLIGILGEETRLAEQKLGQAFQGFIEAEQDALSARSGDRLLALGASVPQVWRPLPAPEALRDLLTDWEKAAANGLAYSALISPVFAGTYFGVSQAVALDARRHSVAVLSNAKLINPWEEDVLLTALLAAASTVAFSPGKHFAQPHRINASKDLSFHKQRILSDRTLEVGSVMDRWIHKLVDRGRRGTEGHLVWQQSVDSVTACDLIKQNVAAVYADPPYTAQQYSRFYHALDTLVQGIPRPLQRVNGRVTGGLYPEGRYLSPYCSRRQARPAFTRLARLCRDAGTSMLLSYSTSSKDSTGNARMISMPTLFDILGSTFGRNAIEVIEFRHLYRQFNQSCMARDNRADPEVLVVAHAT